MKIFPEDIENILDFNLNDILKKQIEDYNLLYEELTKEERDRYLLDVINVLMNDITFSGKHRIYECEKGWNDNLEMLKQHKDSKYLIPKYHGKYKLVRWKGDVIKPKIENFDYKIHISFVDAILQHYIGDCENVFEFGCGPAYHLLRLNEFNKDLNLYGLDCATSSQRIINEINNKLDVNIIPYNFDFFNPNYDVEVPEKSIFFTVAALEQVGDNFGSYIDFIFDKSPDICINIEPMSELLDDNNLIDSLSVKYFDKRKYLNGFLSHLNNLEKEGKIEIIKQQRIFSGSYFIEGHSLVVWKINK